MSKTYNDLPYTNMPDELDELDIVVYEDVSASNKQYVDQYLELIRNGNFTEAQIVYDQHNLASVIVNAETLNKMCQAIIALERFYKDDIQMYINTLTRAMAEGEGLATANSVKTFPIVIYGLNNSSYPNGEDYAEQNGFLWETKSGEGGLTYYVLTLYNTEVYCMNDEIMFYHPASTVFPRSNAPSEFEIKFANSLFITPYPDGSKVEIKTYIKPDFDYITLYVQGIQWHQPSPYNLLSEEE